VGKQLAESEGDTETGRCAAVRSDGAVAPDKATRHTILVDNPARLYEFAEV